MDSVAAFFDEKIASKLRDDPDSAMQIGEIFQFVISGDGGGTWTVDLKNGPTLTAEANDDATCILKVTDEDFLALINGEVSGMELFGTGRLTVERDVMAAMKLEKLIK